MGPNDAGSVAQAHHGPSAPRPACARLRHLYQAHRFDYETSWRRRCRPSPTSSAPSKAPTSASRNGPPSSCGPGPALAQDLGIQLISNQPQYSPCGASSRARSSPPPANSASRRSSVPGPGRPHRQVPPRCGRAGGLRAPPTRRAAAGGSSSFTDEILTAVQSWNPGRRAQPHDGLQMDWPGCCATTRSQRH